MTAVVDALAPQDRESAIAELVADGVDVLRDIVRIISPSTPTPPAGKPRSSEAARAELFDYLQILSDGANEFEDRDDSDEAAAAFITHVVGVTERYGDHLFHCFDDPRIPATSNQLEGFFGASKSHQRSALGTSSTAGGVAQNLGADYLIAFAFARTHSADDIVIRLAAKTRADYEQVRDELEHAELPARLRRSRRRDPERHLAALLQQWRDST